MPKIVILGSCRYEPYEILYTPHRIDGDDEAGYQKAKKIYGPLIEQCDECWVFAPDGIGYHTARDIKTALEQGKIVRLLVDSPITRMLFKGAAERADKSV